MLCTTRQVDERFRALLSDVLADTATKNAALERRIELLIGRIAELEHYVGVRKHKSVEKWQFQQVAGDLNIPKARRPRDAHARLRDASRSRNPHPKGGANDG